MRKGFTLVEVLIVVLILGLLVAVFGSAANSISVDGKCVRNGYVKASRSRLSRYCTKVQNGNTIVIHVDSINER
jgi:prepilin-type N-terminal cleavage/methylation domain-containing protein